MRKGTQGKREVTWGQHEVPLADIVRDTTYQVRTDTDRATVARYAAAMRAGQTFPALRVGILVGAWVLLDGWHRMEAMAAAGITRATVEAAVMTEAEARWEAAKANMLHGRPLAKGEVRQAFRVFIRTDQHRRGHRFLSLRDIARAFGVTHPTVRAWMAKDCPAVLRKINAGHQGGRGGLRDGPAPEERRTRDAHDAVAQARANARGICCPHRRGELVQALEEALREIREEAPWVKPEAMPF